MTTEEWGVWVWPVDEQWARIMCAGGGKTVGEVMGLAAKWVEVLGVDAAAVGAVCEVRSRYGVFAWALPHDPDEWALALKRGRRILDQVSEGEEWTW